jgi:hypothetical protein
MRPGGAHDAKILFRHQDDSFPKGIGANEFKHVQTLVHELTHVIEDQHGDYNVSAKSEAPLLLSAAPVRPVVGADRSRKFHRRRPQNQYLDAIQGGTGTMWTRRSSAISAISAPGSGASSKRAYTSCLTNAYHIDTRAASDRRPRRLWQSIFRRWYFPETSANIRCKDGTPASATGRFTETDGRFKDAVWTFVWDQGVLKSIDLNHDDYTFRIDDYCWTGGSELKLKFTATSRKRRTPHSITTHCPSRWTQGPTTWPAASFPMSAPSRSLEDAQRFPPQPVVREDPVP